MNKYIIVFDDVNRDGDISSIGPFEDWATAIEYGEDHIKGDVSWRISELEEPQ